jgi:hypothetical protein
MPTSGPPETETIQLAKRFVAAIKAHDLDGLLALMTSTIASSIRSARSSPVAIGYLASSPHRTPAGSDSMRRSTNRR